ncbi:uncharacterized protein PAN0_039d6337 [Moesziomyces antarcticus]|uniref:Uncharacterized protein n=1 Tax=Pseudozyma antarctica TaxID=84753 RepID=A0A081CN58_PSEA2|nr:uncharacterized protein PAN0_039d6337 [Moesziomyces antarcticus]GAK68104.1 hypothetical protein PAN0_039d6337 [Moesziomyces antarcticus]
MDKVVVEVMDKGDDLDVDLSALLERLEKYDWPEKLGASIKASLDDLMAAPQIDSPTLLAKLEELQKSCPDLQISVQETHKDGDGEQQGDSSQLCEDASEGSQQRQVF